MCNRTRVYWINVYQFVCQLLFMPFFPTLLWEQWMSSPVVNMIILPCTSGDSALRRWHTWVVDIVALHAVDVMFHTHSLYPWQWIFSSSFFIISPWWPFNKQSFYSKYFTVSVLETFKTGVCVCHHWLKYMLGNQFHTRQQDCIFRVIYYKLHQFVSVTTV